MTCACRASESIECVAKRYGKTYLDTAATGEFCECDCHDVDSHGDNEYDETEVES